MHSLARSAFIALGFTLAAGGCVVVPADLPEARFSAALVDSLVWEAEPGPETLWHVEVRGDTAVDTIPGVLTRLPVVAVPRTGVVGFRVDTADAGRLRGFRYDPAKKSVKGIPLAPDVARWFAEPALSPDGRHVAYVGGDLRSPRAVVRIFPRGRIVAEGPVVRMPESDFVDNRARWTSPDTFEVWVQTGDTPRRHVRVRGSVRGGVFATDTVVAAGDTAGAR